MHRFELEHADGTPLAPWRCNARTGSPGSERAFHVSVIHAAYVRAASRVGGRAFTPRGEHPARNRACQFGSSICGKLFRAGPPRAIGPRAFLTRGASPCIHEVIPGGESGSRTPLYRGRRRSAAALALCSAGEGGGAAAAPPGWLQKTPQGLRRGRSRRPRRSLPRRKPQRARHPPNSHSAPLGQRQTNSGGSPS
jgi:hypothetical protein